MDAQAMTLLDAFNAAQAYDSQLASARGARDAAYEKSTQGFAGLLPTVSATAASPGVCDRLDLILGRRPVVAVPVRPLRQYVLDAARRGDVGLEREPALRGLNLEFQ
jgi:hypothetical protein